MSHVNKRREKIGNKREKERKMIGKEERKKREDNTAREGKNREREVKKSVNACECVLYFSFETAVEPDMSQTRSPVVHCTIEALWFPQPSSVHDSFISRAESTCLCIRHTLFGLSCCCLRLETSTLHGDNQLFQCLQPLPRTCWQYHSISNVPRSTTDPVVRSTFHHKPRRAIHQVARSHSLRYHVKVDRCDDTFSRSKRLKAI